LTKKTGDNTIVYDEKCGGFPAIKHFNHPKDSKLHYLLIIGGVDYDKKEFSKKIQVYLVSIGKF
jgi:hypothetical protein